MITPLTSRTIFAAGTPTVLVTAATKILTIATQPTAGDTLTFDDVIYTWVANGTAAVAGEIDVGTDLATAKTALLAAINGTDDLNDANPYITLSAFSTNDSTITAVGTGHDSNVDIYETFDAVGNIVTGSLTGGKDATVASKGSILFDANNIYLFTADNTFAVIPIGSDPYDANVTTLPTYTVATAPDEAANEGRVIYISDGDAGDPCLAYSDGTDWLVVALGIAAAIA